MVIESLPATDKVLITFQLALLHLLEFTQLLLFFTDGLTSLLDGADAH